MKKSKESEGENDVDIISNLPDPVLHSILSLLPTTEEVVRTSILSTRWRYLWIPIPFLDIDCNRALKPSINFEKHKFKEFVYWILLNKTLDLDSFRLRCENHYNMSTVGRWIHAAVMRKVKSLDLSFCPMVKDHEVMELPYSLITCDSLEVLRLFLFEGRLSLPTVTGFRALKVLELNSIRLLDDDLVKQFFKSCPLLEDLSLIDCLLHTIDNLSISCMNLKTLRIDNRNMDFYYQESDDSGMSDNEDMCNGLEISCPNLVFLEYAGYMPYFFSSENLELLKKAVIHPQSSFESSGYTIWELIAGVSHVESLSLNPFFIQAISLARVRDGVFPASFPNLKTLEIFTAIDNRDMKVVIWILKCSPNLESFHLIIQKEIFHPNVSELDEVLARHLKRVEFLEFNGEKWKLDMARFLLKHGNVLKEIVFSWSDEVRYHEKSTETENEVLKFWDSKASSTVKLVTVLKEPEH